MTTYTTVQGDTWDGIAKKHLGNERFMSELIKANFAYCLYSILPANLELTLPDVDEEQATLNNDLLPPWKR